MYGYAMYHNAANGHLNGTWYPPNATVYDYRYNTTLDGSDYHVHCYCVEEWPCGCGTANSTSFFDELPPGTCDMRKEDNFTTVYINGTLAGEVEQDSGASALGINMYSTVFIIGAVFAFF